MMTNNKFKISLFAVLVSACLCSSASADTFQIDKDSSKFLFRIKSGIGYYITGRFSDVSGSVQVNGGAIKGGEGAIRLSGIDTGMEEMDEHLKGADFFDASKYPEGKFKIKSVQDKTMTVALTIKGVTKDVVCEYALIGPVKDREGKARLAASITASLNRHDFGLTLDPKAKDGQPLLGETVDLLIDLQAVK